MAVLVGPTGPRGDRGLQGPVGPRGFDGKRGPNGKNGKDGGQGPKGDRGDRGFPGNDGKQGIQGRQGKDGAAGKDGSIAGIEHTLLPSDVASDSTPGAGLTAAARDHTHKGVRSIRADAQPQLFGDVVLASGAGISMSQVGNTITLSSSGTGSPLTFTQGLVNILGTVHNTFFTGAGTDQTLYGGADATGSLHLSSTSNATKGSIFLGLAGDTIDVLPLAAGGYVTAAGTTGELGVVASIPYSDISGAPAPISLPAGEVAFGTGSGITSDSSLQYSTSLDQLQISFTKATGQNGLKVTNSSSAATAFANLALVNDLGDGSRADIYYTSSAYASSDSLPSSLTFATAAGSASAIIFSPNNTKALIATESAVTLPSLAAGGLVLADASGVLGLTTIGTGLSLVGTTLSATGSDHKLSIDGTDTTYNFLAAKLTATVPAVATVVGSGWPASPPSSGLKLWLAADAGVTIGTGVANWADQSGNGNDFSQATGGNQPTFISSAINGLPAIGFSGSSQFLSNSGFAISGAKHVVFVRKLGVIPAITSFYAPFNFNDGASGVGAIMYFAATAGNYQNITFQQDLVGISNSVGSNATPDMSWHADDWSYDGVSNTAPGSYVYEIDGTPLSLANDVSVYAAQTTTVSAIGSDVSTGNSFGSYFQGDIAEILVYDHVLSPTDLGNLKGYLEGRYGITIAGATGGGGGAETLDVSVLYDNSTVVLNGSNELSVGTVPYASISGAPAPDHKLSIDGSDTTYDFLAAKLTTTLPLATTVVFGFPSTPPSSGLKLWLKGDAGVTLSGSNVTNWADQSGNANNVSVPVGYAAPLINMTSVGGLPGVRFDNSVALANLQGAASPVAVGSDRSVIAVVSGPAGSYFTFRTFLPDNTLQTSLYSDHQSSQAYDPSPPNPSPMVAEAYEQVGSMGVMYQNGTALTMTPQVGPGTVATDSGTDGFNVGNLSGALLTHFGIPDLQAGCEICEILVYDHVLNGTDIGLVRGYLQGRYGIVIAGSTGSGGETLDVSVLYDSSTIVLNGSNQLSVGTVPYASISGVPSFLTDLTGDVTATGPGSAAATIAGHAVTYAKMQQASGLSVLGVSGSSTADIAEITATANDQVLQEIGGVLAFHTLSYSQLTGVPAALTALTGDVVAAGPGSSAAVIQSHVVDFAKMQQASASVLWGNPTGSLADVSEITLGAGLSFVGTTLVASGSSDHKLSIDGTDTTYDYLAAKLTATLPAVVTVVNPGSAETLDVSVAYDNTSIGAPFSGQLALIGIPDATPLAGDLIFPAYSAPATPPAGFTYVWSDGLNGNLWIMNELAVSSHTAQTTSSPTHEFFNGLNDDGSFSSAQPDFADLTGQATYAQIQDESAHTLLGNPGGSLTTPSEITLGAGLAFSGTTIVNTGTADHKVLVDGSDSTPDYLGNKIVVTAPITKSIFIPAPPTSGLNLWLKADAGVTLSGSNVTAWADQSGNGNNYVQATGGKQPTVTASAINGLPAITFNGSSQFLTSGFQISGAKNVLVVYRLAAAVVGFQCPYQFVNSGATLETIHYYTDGTGGYDRASFQDDISGSSSSVGITATLDTSFHFLERGFNGGTNSSPGSYTSSLDGSSQTIAANGTFGFTSGYVSSLGAQSTSANTGASFFDGEIAEILVYDHVLSSPDLAAVRAYIQNRYGITIAGAGSAVEAVNLGLAYDNTSIGAPFSGQLALIGIPDATPLAGDLIFPAYSAPATPPAGFTYVWSDGLNGNLWIMNELAVSSHTAQTTSSPTHEFFNGLNDDGSFSSAQPDFADLTGQATYAQIQDESAHTLLGNPGGSLTTPSEITLGAGLSFSGTTIVNTVTGGITQLTSDVTAGPGSGSQAATIAAHVVQFAKMQQIGAQHLVGNPTGSTADISEFALGVGLDFHNYGTGLTLRNSSPLSDLAVTAPLQLSGTTIGWSGLGANLAMYASAVGTPSTDSTFTFDPTNKILGAEAIGINGVTPSANQYLAGGNVTNSVRAQVAWYVGGSSSPDNPDNTLFLISQNSGATIPAGRTTGIWATARVQPNGYSGTSTPNITEATTLYVDGAPTLTGAVGSLYALHVAGGTTSLDGPVSMPAVAGAHNSYGMFIGTTGTLSSAAQVQWDGTSLTLSTDTTQWPYISMEPTDGVDGGGVSIVTPNTVVAGTNSTLRSIILGGGVQNINGTTNITRLDQIYVNASKLNGVTAGSTATTATTMAIAGAPTSGGVTNAVTYTRGYALDVMADATHLGGALVTEGGTVATGGSGGDIIPNVAGNALFITGTTSFQTIKSTTYKDGSMITLWFTSNVTALHNTAGAYTSMSLKGGVNASCLANTCLTLLLKSGSWYEVSRSF